MASLKIRTGTAKKVAKGVVELSGQAVALYEIGKNLEKRLVFGYCLQPGETVTKGEGDDYSVEF